MTRLLEPVRVTEGIRVTHVARSVMFPGAYVLSTRGGPNYFIRGVPNWIKAGIAVHGEMTLIIRRLENTQFIESILTNESQA